MDQRAQYGVAAHWMYKEQAGKSQATTQDDLLWLKHLSDWQAETKDPGEFLDALRFEIGAKEVYVFTPKGKVVGLPTGATAVDFAYAVHTEVGHKTIGAKVNGRITPLDSVLSSGDVVEVLTSKSVDASPSKDWLNFVASPRARAKIKHHFSQERREDAIEAGKDQLTKTMRKLGLPLQQLMSADSLGKIVGELGIQDLSALFASIGEGQISAQSIIDRLTVPGVNEDENESEFELPSAPKSFRKVATGDSGVLVKGDGDVMVKLARCCTPVPGDEIMGFVTRGSGVSVHRNDCKNADSLKLESERLVDVSWAPSSKRLFLVQIQVEALDRSGLLSDVTRVLSEHHVNILSASVSTRTDRIALSRFVFEMGDPAALDHLLAAVKRIEAVYDVYRVSQ
jgi:GTP pyrophosphokinase